MLFGLEKRERTKNEHKSQLWWYAADLKTLVEEAVARRSMNELKVGSRIKDNDPRMGSRVLEIESLDERYVYAASQWRQFRILRTRVFVDAKPRRTGFSLVREA